MRIPRIPHGFTIFGAGAATASALASHNSSQNSNAILKEENAKLRQELKEGNAKLRQELQEIKENGDKTLQTVQNVGEEVKTIKKDFTEHINNTKKLINNFTIPSLQDLKDLATNYFNFISSFDLQQQILIFNSLNSFLLLSLLLSFILGKYTNLLINKFNLEIRFPKISKILQLRLQAQKYYFVYLTILGLSSILFNLFSNLYILLT